MASKAFRSNKNLKLERGFEFAVPGFFKIWIKWAISFVNWDLSQFSWFSNFTRSMIDNWLNLPRISKPWTCYWEARTFVIIIVADTSKSSQNICQLDFVAANGIKFYWMRGRKKNLLDNLNSSRLRKHDATLFSQRSSFNVSMTTQR